MGGLNSNGTPCNGISVRESVIRAGSGSVSLPALAGLVRGATHATGAGLVGLLFWWITHR